MCDASHGEDDLRIEWVLLIALLFALAVRYLVKRAAPWIRRHALKWDPDVRRQILWVVDTVYPTWRTDAGGPRSRNRDGAEYKLPRVRRLRNAPVVLIGGVYLDVMVHPVNVTELKGGEFGDLDSIVLDEGGSTWWVGEGLWSKFRIKSYLHTKTGQLKPFGRELHRRLRKAPWRRGRISRPVKGKSSAISVILEQGDGSFHTTFTFRGALADLKFSADLIRAVQKQTRNGGLLYISGYFRTNLSDQFCDALEKISPNVLVCIDHGRFQSTEHPASVAALRAAFRKNLIDFYICTWDEICEFMSASGVERIEGEEYGTLRKFMASGLLPYTTIVRGDLSSSGASAYLLIRNELLVVGHAADVLRTEHRLGRGNEFNAALIYHLIRGASDQSFQDAVYNAVSLALESWVGVPEKVIGD